MSKWVVCICRGADTRRTGERREPLAEGKLDMLRATPRIVTHLRLDGRLGACRESDGGSAATLIYSSRSGKGAPTGVGRR